MRASFPGGFVSWVVSRSGDLSACRHGGVNWRASYQSPKAVSYRIQPHQTHGEDNGPGECLLECAMTSKGSRTGAVVCVVPSSVGPRGDCRSRYIYRLKMGGRQERDWDWPPAKKWSNPTAVIYPFCPGLEKVRHLQFLFPLIKGRYPANDNITKGELLNGVRFTSTGATVSSLCVRLPSGTIEQSETILRFKEHPVYKTVNLNGHPHGRM